MLNLVLYQPEIPANTGNLIRLSANLGATLHLIHPLGFSLDEKSVRRAGLDYHELAVVREHASYEDFLRTEQPAHLYGLSTKGQRLYTEVSYQAGDYLMFGQETRGLPEEIRQSLGERLIRVPMRPGCRSINLSNTAALVAYEAWRQLGFVGAS